MSAMPSSFYYTPNIAAHGWHSLNDAIKNLFNATPEEVGKFIIAPLAQGIIGYAIGMEMHRVYAPLTEKIIQLLGAPLDLADPFSGLGLKSMTLLAPFICVAGPILEEAMFRGDLQKALGDKFESFYKNFSFSNANVKMAARVSAVFFASVFFGLVHFSNALFFWCNPILFLPQAVAATIMGFIFGVAKELSGELYVPIGMHIGNNTLAWAHYLTKA